MKLTPEPAPLYLRVHTRETNKRDKKKLRAGEDSEWKPPKQWANFALVFDCETTIDLRQDLNFLWWRFCELKNEEAYVCQREGVVYADHLPQESIDLIRRFAEGKRAQVEQGWSDEIKVQSRTEFVNNEFWDVLRMGALVACFNAPFDISRLAIKYGDAKRKNAGWSMEVWRHKKKPQQRETLKPHITMKAKDSRSAFINLAGGDPANRLVYRGRFLDLAVLGWALRNTHMTLEGYLKSFGLEGKMEHEPTGRVTKAELEYGRRDVERTLELLNAMKKEYDGFKLEIAPERAMSAASITKAFLDEMCVQQPMEKFAVPDAILGKCMQAYYGGRSEVRIRHAEMPVVVCDTTSEYPSVAALMNLWRLIIAAEVRVEKCTSEAQRALNRATLDSILNPGLWRDLAFFAAVKPAGDVLPVRTVYRKHDYSTPDDYTDTGDTNIGVNPLHSKEMIWYAGPDLAASKLQTGRSPHVVEAFRIVPVGIQEGTQPKQIGTTTINPANELDDFFRVVIEERKRLDEKHPHYLLLKIIANALYGIFAELNKYEFGKNSAKHLEVFSGEAQFEETRCDIERPGKWNFAPGAALITAGGRLMLTVLECMVRQMGGTYLLTDTDSMFFVASRTGELVACPGGSHKLPDGTAAVRPITWKQVKRICAKLNRLNPYDPKIVSEILKIEPCNYDGAGKQHQLFGLAVSAKRYLIYKRRKSRVEIIKPSEHGLGIAYVPDRRKRYMPADCKDRKTDYPRWVVEAWERLLDDHFRNIRDSENAVVTKQLWFAKLPAVMRVRITTPNVMKALQKRDPASAKPYNFALSPILLEAPAKCTLVAPFSKEPSTWLSKTYAEINTGDAVKLNTDYKGTKLLPQTLANIVWRHYQHPEDKSLGPDGKPCGPYTPGLLLRRPIEGMKPFVFIGKEIERRSQEDEDISIIVNRGPVQYQPRQTLNTRAADPRLIFRAKQFPLRRLMRESGASQHAVERFLRGGRVHPSTRKQLTQAIEELEREANRGARPVGPGVH